MARLAAREAKISRASRMASVASATRPRASRQRPWPEERLGTLPRHLEPLPAQGGVGEELGGFGVRAKVLEKERPGGGQGVLVQRVDGLEALGEARGEFGISCGERRADRIGEVRRVAHVAPDVWGPLQLGEKGKGAGGFPQVEAERGGGREGLGEELGLRHLPGLLRGPVGERGGPRRALLAR